MSLYRKYRPRGFADVVGQDHIVTTLEQAIGQDKVAHAYLFSGPRGTGKTSVARILAKILLTRGIDDENIQKQIIHAVDEESLVDLLEIDAASYTQVDHIRDLIEKMQFSPVAARAKVYIIDEVHMLSKSAFNALLKTLEEPPEYAFFILATTELTKIPLTIQSRCQRFPFRSLREEDIIRRLQYIADQERIAVERPGLRAIAHYAQGSMRDAISLLDQLRALEKITLEDVKNRVGEPGQEEVEAILAALAANDRKALLDLVRKFEDAGIPLEILLRQLLAAVRARLHEAIEQGQPLDELSQMLDVLLKAVRDIRIAPLPALVLESALLTLCGEPQKTERRAFFAPRRKKENGEREEETEETPVKPDTSADTGKTATPEEAVIEAPVLSIESVRDTWPKVLASTSPPAVKISLKNGRVHSLRDLTVTMSFSSAFHRDKVANLDASRQIEAILERIFRRKLRLECIVEQETNGATPDEKLVNLVEAAAEVF